VGRIPSFFFSNALALYNIRESPYEGDLGSQGGRILRLDRPNTRREQLNAALDWMREASRPDQWATYEIVDTNEEVSLGDIPSQWSRSLLEKNKKFSNIRDLGKNFFKKNVESRENIFKSDSSKNKVFFAQ
jgi:hypothetical protein